MTEESNNFENIISSESSENTIDKRKKAPATPKLKKMQYDVLPGVSNSGPLRRTDGYNQGIKLEDYATDKNQGDVVLGFGGVEALNEDRANQQSWTEQARNMIGQAVVGEVIGGTIEGFGYLGEVGNAIDYLGGTEREFGNWMTDLGKDTREFAQENMAIHQVKDSGMGDSGWWFNNGVSVASSLSMLIPTGTASKALGMLGKFASKGAGVISKSLDFASKMGKYERWMAEGITQAVVSRHIENSMEASGVFKEQKESLMKKVNPKTQELFTEDEAAELASHGASSTYRANWAMLLQDIPQYLALGKVFDPTQMKMISKYDEIVASGVKPGIKNTLKVAAGTFASEGAEESYQYYVAERGKLLSDLKAGLISESEYDRKTSEKIGDKEMLTSAFWGGLGGNLFQGAGKLTSELFKSKERKENENNYAEIQGEYIKRRGNSFQLMQSEIAKADQSGDPVKRQAAIDGSGVSMAVDAIDNGKFPEYIESLQGMSKMSEAEQVGFEQKLGIRLEPELFKKYVPSLISQAHSIRESYLKHLNKNESSIAAKMASNDHYVKSFDNRSKEVTKEIQNIKDSVPNSNKLTNYYQEKFSTKGNLLALKKANEIHESAIKNTEVEYQIKNRKDLIDKNNKVIEKLSLKMNEFNSNDPRTKDEKDSDKLIGAGYEQSADELITKAVEYTLLTDAINLMQKENVKIKSKEYQEEFKSHQDKKKVNSISSIEDAEQAKINVKENSGNSEKRKSELLSLIDERIEAIKKEEKSKIAKEKQSGHKDKLKQERVDSELDNPISVPDSNITPVGKNLEDEFSTEEVDISAEMTNKSEESKRKIIDSQLNIGVPHIFTDTQQGKNYKEWMLNGKDKLGTVVSINVSKGNYKNVTPENVSEALDSFKKGIINDNVIDYLPLIATFGETNNERDSDKKEAYLGSKVATTTQLHAELWEKDREVRKSIIEEILKSKSPLKTLVTAQYGGIVNSSPLIDGVVPENNIGDFNHLSSALDEMFDLKGSQASISQIVQALEPNLMYTNEFGDLMTLDGERHKEYLGKSMSLPMLTGSTSARVPMRGTIFLNVPKADGSNFPLKLNVKKHSKEEAEIIADLLVSVIKKENKFNTPLSQIDPQIRSRINENMKTELEAMENSDPSLMEIVDFFTYVSDQTEGKTSELFISGEWLNFGNKGLKITPKSLFNKEKLVDFLINTKRRQFNVALWETSPEYRSYAISSGLLNTDAVVNGPLFVGNTNIYVKAPLSAKSLTVNSAKMLQHTPTVKGEKPRSERRKMSEKTGVYSDKSTNGKFAATYYEKNGDAVELLRDTEALALQAVNDRYNNESKNGPATKSVVNSQPLKKNKDDMSDLPVQDKRDINVLVKKDEKSNFNLTIKDGGVIINNSTGKELDSKKDAKLINKALLKSGLLKYEKITVDKQVYAATAIGTIVNITPGSSSNGSEILKTSPIGKKVMEKYTGKFTGKTNEIGSEEIIAEFIEEKQESSEVNDPKMLLMGMNSLNLSNESAIKQEQEDLSSIEKVNTSSNLFDIALEAEPVKESFTESKNPVDIFNEKDSVDDISNLFEDEYGCGFI